MSSLFENALSLLLPNNGKQDARWLLGSVCAYHLESWHAFLDNFSEPQLMQFLEAAAHAGQMTHLRYFLKTGDMRSAARLYADSERLSPLQIKKSESLLLQRYRHIVRRVQERTSSIWMTEADKWDPAYGDELQFHSRSES